MPTISRRRSKRCAIRVMGTLRRNADDKRTQRQKEADELAARCVRILDQRPLIAHDGHEDLHRELTALQAVLAETERESANQAGSRCRKLMDELEAYAGKSSPGTHRVAEHQDPPD
jgi:hypothetical protein